jgi:hypothetical protein
VSIFSFSGILGYFPTHDCRGCLSSACFMLPGTQKQQCRCCCYTARALRSMR